MNGTILLLVTCLVEGMVLATPPPEPPAQSAGMTPSIGRVIVTQVPARGDVGESGLPAASDPWPDLPEASRVVTVDPTHPDEGVRNLTRGFASAGRPDLSFDGSRVLFVAKRSSAGPCDVWEMNCDGSGQRQVTAQEGNCKEAIYLSAIYTIDLEEPRAQIAFCADPGTGEVGALFTCGMDGRRVRQITFDPLGSGDPLLLSDGRLLFSRPLPHAPGQVHRDGTAFFTVNTDGTDVFAFAGINEAPAMRGMPCETPSGRVVYVESKIGGGEGGGSLASVSRTRSLHTRVCVGGETDGLYGSPCAMADGNLLVSHRPNGAGSYGIYLLDPRTGTRLMTVLDTPEWHEVDPVAVEPRPVPAGRSSVVDERLQTGQIYCLDVYRQDGRAGRAGGIEGESIRKVRLLQATGSRRGASDAADVGHRPDFDNAILDEALLGEAPVEADGSFYLKVPARTPLRLETLNAEGNIVQAMQSWIWVMPNESRGCIGCHEDRELAPPNRHVLALMKPPHAVGVGSGDSAGTSANLRRTGEHVR